MSGSDSQREAAKKLGLPKTASQADIEKKYSDNFRREIAREFGLPEPASWDEIYKERWVISRREAA